MLSANMKPSLLYKVNQGLRKVKGKKATEARDNGQRRREREGDFVGLGKLSEGFKLSGCESGSW